MSTHRIRTGRLFAVLGLALAGACLLGVMFGSTALPLDQLFKSGIGHVRLARVLMAVVAGASLSVSGVIFQALLRNPLAEPYVLGVSSGAGLAAAATIVLGISALGVWTLPATAFAGAVGTMFLVYAIARGARGAVPIHTLLLSGVVVGSVLGSLLMFMVSVAPTQKLHDVLWWLMGSLQIYDWNLLWTATAVVTVGIALTILFARDLNVMVLGEESAAHLGLHVEHAKKMFIVIASLMTGSAVAACGLIGFVGLIVPHSVRLAIGPDHRRLVPASALAGAAFLVLADTFSRSVLPIEIPIGVVTAFVGGPFFLVLLKRGPGGLRA